MKNDIQSNYDMAEAVACASNGVGAVNSVSVDHNGSPSASFFVSVGDVGASGTLDLKVQMSDDNSAWVDEDGATGNDISVAQLTAVGTAQLNVSNPQKRYSRIVGTVAVNAVVFGAVSVAGPKRHIVPA